MKTPRSSWTQPHVVKSATMTPWPPTRTTSSLRIAARPHIALKNPPTNRMIAANVAHPVGRYSSRGTDVLEGVGVVVAMSVLSPISSPNAGPAEGERASPSGGDAPSPVARRASGRAAAHLGRPRHRPRRDGRRAAAHRPGAALAAHPPAALRRGARARGVARG